MRLKLSARVRSSRLTSRHPSSPSTCIPFFRFPSSLPVMVFARGVVARPRVAPRDAVADGLASADEAAADLAPVPSKTQPDALYQYIETFFCCCRIVSYDTGMREMFNLYVHPMSRRS